MSERYDLEIILGYRSKTGYKGLLKSREWVRGLPVDMKIQVINNSPKAFPGAKVNCHIKEYGGAMGQGSLSWGAVKEILIPKLRPGESATLPLMGFYPLIDGLCEVCIEVQAPAKSEVWVTGWRQPIPQQNMITGYYNVVRREELEIIKLLSKLQKGE